MKPEIKAKWVAALRSGKYKQTDGLLHNPKDDGFCCLGVLCDLYAKEFHDGQWFEMGAEDEELPAPKVVNWARLSESDPRVSICEVDARLSCHNDGLSSSGVKRTFEEIAEAIEAQL